MGDVTKAINDYISNVIQLARDNISDAVSSREWLLDRIKKVVSDRVNGPALYPDEPFIHFGSYFKGTKVQTVDEFDILVVIDSNTGIFNSGGITIGNGLGSASPNHKYDDKYRKSDDSGVSPAKTLNWLQGVVEQILEDYGGEAPVRNSQAITATIKSKNLKIDLVPAGIFKRISDGTTFYDIPRGDKDNGWILTSPRLDIEELDRIAKGKDNFRNVIRIAKRVKDTHGFTVGSFAIETALVAYGRQNQWFGDLYYDVKWSLKFLAAGFRGGTISDPYDRNNNLITGVESLGWYAERLDKVVSELEECQQIDDQERVYKRVHAAFENI